MKKTFLILSSLLVVVCCWGQTKTNNKHKSAAKNNADVRTIPLTKSEFLVKVANFEANQDEWKYLGDKPAIIDFHASWCGPCKVIAPILEELAAEYGDSIYVYKVDIDKEQEIATAFNICADGGCSADDTRCYVERHYQRSYRKGFAKKEISV